MKILFASILSLLTATPALAGQLVCSDATQRVKFAQQRYDGGAPPPPSLVTIRQEAWVDGVSLGQNEYSDERGWVLKFSTHLSDQQPDLSSVTDVRRNLVMTTYATRLRLSEGEQVHFDGYVICQDESDLIPRP